MKVAQRRKVAIKVLIVFTVLLIVVAVYLYSVRETPVVYRHVERGGPVDEPAFAIFNPFRNRGPERQAEAFLRLLKEGHCEQALSVLPVKQEYLQELCQREAKSPLLGWRLTNRSDEGNKVRMYYWVKRKGYNGYQGQLWINLEKRGEDWRATEYECFY
jgi:hypothetical protein